MDSTWFATTFGLIPDGRVARSHDFIRQSEFARHLPAQSELPPMVTVLPKQISATLNPRRRGATLIFTFSIGWWPTKGMGLALSGMI